MLRRLINRLPPSLRCYCTLGHLLWLVLLVVVFLVWGHGA